jgi:hypothetical protein
MRHSLRSHPGYPCRAVASIEVDVEQRQRGSLALAYVVTGTIGSVLLPDRVPNTRNDRLWEHTCFEIFIRPATDIPYYEFNFSPSTQWAAYHFGRYRGARRIVSEIDTIRIDVETSATRCVLRTELALDPLTDLPRDTGWRVGLSAIIEEADGRKSYWALAHPPGDADFHHADCFAHEFSPA